MSAPIGVGDWVECVDLTPCGGEHLFGFAPFLVLGAVYRVSGVVPGGLVSTGLDSVEVDGCDRLDPWGRPWVFALYHFRPIYPGNGLLKKLMEPVPGLESEIIREGGPLVWARA